MKSRAFLIFVPLAIVLSTLLRPPPAAAVGPWAGGWFRAAAAAASPIQRRGAASSEPWDDQRHQAEDVCPIYPAFPDPAPKGARVPGFLIVGAQKGGTTFLHNVLSEVLPHLLPLPSPSRPPDRYDAFQYVGRRYLYFRPEYRLVACFLGPPNEAVGPSNDGQVARNLRRSHSATLVAQLRAPVSTASPALSACSCVLRIVGLHGRDRWGLEGIEWLVGLGDLCRAARKEL